MSEGDEPVPDPSALRAATGEVAPGEPIPDPEQPVEDEPPHLALVRGGDDLLDVMAQQTAGVLEQVGARLTPNGRPLRLRTLTELLTDPDTLKPPEVVTPRTAHRGRVTLVIGREKLSGKSTYLTAAGAAVTRGADFLGERCLAGSVLWISADQEHTSEIAQRAVRFGADPDRFHVLWPREAFADLAAALSQLDPVLVIIDTLASFARALVDDPHSSAQWPNVLLPLVTLAREGNLAVAIAAHAKKNENGGYRDSTAIGALVDTLLELQPDGGNPARRNVTVVGRWPAPNFAVELMGDHYELVAGGELSLDARILVYIEGHPRCSKRVLRDGIGGRGEDVDVALGRLLNRGAVTNAGSESRHAYVAGTSAPEPSLLVPEGTAQEPDDTPF